MSEENKAIVRQAYDNFKAGRIDKLLELMSDDIDWTLPEVEGIPFGGKRSGLKSVGEFFVIVNNSQESLSFEPREVIAEGDKVVALGTYTWRVRSTKREFTGDFAHAWTFRDGKVIRFHEYTDTAALANAYQKAASA
ncbi:MAG TPA: nuclear transport factor 2 family protein [Pyrinomonadaceae bacterium]|nr:nuclear transport factor 2 family protein [Pyrinomonadaceae bacterium]